MSKNNTIKRMKKSELGKRLIDEEETGDVHYMGGDPQDAPNLSV